MKHVHVFTSAAFNYIPKVRLLFRSLRDHHPEWRKHLALADELRSGIDLSSEPFDDVIPISDLDIPGWRGWAFCHTLVELATAIKPFALRRLLGLPDSAKVIYLDPDTVTFSRLDDILDALDEANIVLTSHQTSPETTISAVIDNEICSLKHGVYNLGFIGVAATEVGRGFADWWAKRVYHFCRADIRHGLFTDQRWIDLVPAFFAGVAIMRSTRHNVATWNVTTRVLSRDGQGNYTVDGNPLGFYHFTGFDSGGHRLMAAKNATGNRAVKRLVEWYTNQTKQLARDPLASQPWAFGAFSDGTPISRAQRVVYRERVDLQRKFRNPFDASGYLHWWNTRGKLDYPELFNTMTQADALNKISEILTPGYRGGEAALDWPKLVRLTRQAFGQPRTGLELCKRGWEVLRNEGVGGLKRRFLS